MPSAFPCFSDKCFSSLICASSHPLGPKVAPNEFGAWIIAPVLLLIIPNLDLDNAFSALHYEEVLIASKSHGALAPIFLKSIAIHLPFLSRYFCTSTPSLGKTKSTVKVGSWSAVKPPSRRSHSRTLFYQNPQEVTFQEPVKRYSWRDTLAVSLVSLTLLGRRYYFQHQFCITIRFPFVSRCS